jgi:hypothetical protein
MQYLPPLGPTHTRPLLQEQPPADDDDERLLRDLDAAEGCGFFAAAAIGGVAISWPQAENLVACAQEEMLSCLTLTQP